MEKNDRPTAPTRHALSFADTVRELHHRTAELWWASSEPDLPTLSTYPQREQVAREALVDRFVDVLEEERGASHRNQDQRQAARQRLAAAFEQYLGPALDLDRDQTAFVTTHPFTEVGADFFRQARRLDPSLELGDIVQAGRNLAVMNNVQILLGLPVELTPALLGYSLIYPYSDNLLDDPKITEEAKRGFGDRLAERLVGGDTAPVGHSEKAIWHLVSLIESQFPRRDHRYVYESLLAIHRAQGRSVRLLNSRASPYDVDVLGISLEKGGASVLADGYLVAGALDPAQAEFLYQLGAFLQLGDDLQDLDDNLAGELLTIFSHTARRWPLDRLTTRLLHFGQKVMVGLGSFDAAGLEPLKALVQLATRLLLLEAAGHARRFYSRAYIRDLEIHSPVRFAYLETLRRRLDRRQALWPSLLEAVLSLEAPE